MELPRRVLVGEGVLPELGKFLSDLALEGPLLIVSGPHVRERVGAEIDGALHGAGFSSEWVLTSASTADNLTEVERAIEANGVRTVIGAGGGRSIDLAKLGSFRHDRPFLSIPTSASHDGVASPFASIRELDRPFSLVSRCPVGVLADTRVISMAPPRLLASGCGDLVAKTTAVRDWELAHNVRGEYFGAYAAKLARLSAEIIIAHRAEIGKYGFDAIRLVVEALISAGVAAGIAGSSRPCSGAEHLIAHALDQLAPSNGLHGEKCGVATIFAAHLHGEDWSQIRDTLERVHAPASLRSLGIPEETLIEAVLRAPHIRPERFTILNQRSLTRTEIAEIVRDTDLA